MDVEDGVAKEVRFKCSGDELIIGCEHGRPHVLGDEAAAFNSVVVSILVLRIPLNKVLNRQDHVRRQLIELVGLVNDIGDELLPACDSRFDVFHEWLIYDILRGKRCTDPIVSQFERTDWESR